MSTRATYQITTEKLEVDPVTLYIHYDGYPKGAMGYIKAGLLIESKRGTFIEQFIRINDMAEITPDHNAHGDTEFTYDIIEKEDGQILVSCTDLSSGKTIIDNVPAEECIDGIIRVPELGYIPKPGFVCRTAKVASKYSVIQTTKL